MKYTRDKDRCLDYSKSETEVFAQIVTKMRRTQECFAQQYMLGKGPKVFGMEGPLACKVEIK